MSENSTKRCPRCERSLGAELFHKNRSRVGGLADYCKVCTNQYAKRPDQRAKTYARAAKDPEKIRQQWIKSHDNDEHRARQRLRVKEFMRAQAANLGEIYIKSKIARGSTLKFKDIPQELVELKRVTIQMKRHLKENK